MKRASGVALALVMASLASCDDVTPDAGLDAALRVEGAQFHRGGMPSETRGPLVKNVSVSPIVSPGASGRKCSGVVDPNATAIALAIDGDPGYWTVLAAPPDVTAPGFPTFAAKLGFAATLSGGRRSLIARAVDADGNFGAPFLRPLDVTRPVRPTGKLVIALSWQNAADLDLHVVDPNGIEIWKRNINSYEEPAPGSPPEAPGTPHPGGILDLDSNARCVQDGRRAENVVWQDRPPSGHYLVRVDTFSLCGEQNAPWRVEGFIDGVSAGAAEGNATDFDTRFSHDRGAGVLALELDVP